MATPAVVQTRLSAFATDPWTLAFTDPLTAGTLLVAVVSKGGSADSRVVLSVADGTNGAWTRVGTGTLQGVDPNYRRCDIYYFANNAATSAETVTVEWVGSTVGFLSIYEVSSAKALDVYDAVTDDTGVASQVCASPAMQTADEVFIVGVGAYLAAPSVSNYSPFTLRTNATADNGVIMDYCSANAVSEDGSFTQANSRVGCTMLASFKTASSPAAWTPRVTMVL